MIQDYSELVAEVAERSGFSDVANRASMFVGLAEKMLSRRLRLSGMESISSLQTNHEGRVKLPDDYNEMRFVRVGGQILESRPLRAILSSQIRGYAVQGDFLHSSLTQQEHHCTYFSSLPALEQNGTSWLLQQEPELYLHAVLFQVFTAYDEVEKARMTAAYLLSIVEEVNREDCLKYRSGIRVNLGGFNA